VGPVEGIEPRLQLIPPMQEFTVSRCEVTDQRAEPLPEGVRSDASVLEGLVLNEGGKRGRDVEIRSTNPPA